MGISTFRSLGAQAVWAGLLLLLCTNAATAGIRVECTRGCAPLPPAEQSANLLLIDDTKPEIELTWILTEAPDPKEILQLRAGNPEILDKLPDLGALSFTESNGRWTATQTFRLQDLGRGTFIAATLRRRKASLSIADWEVFRLLRASDMDKRAAGAPIASNLSLALVPEFLQVSSGHGELPHSSGGNEVVWWPIPEGDAGVNIDIDGDNTGVPGVTITHSAPWESQGTSWQQSVMEHLPKIVGHFVDFQDVWFKQSPDEEVKIPGVGNVLVKHYYSAITLFTNATSTVYHAHDLGLHGNSRYFAHETSANLHQTAHPFLWSSYSRREYSADPELLSLIQDGLKGGGSIPGLNHVQQDDGDGGSVYYRVGFRARVAPWSVPDTEQGHFRAGIVHLDIVAARVGFGDVETPASGGSGLCKIIACGDSSKVDLQHPPRGYDVAAPVAINGSQSGTLVMIQGQPTLAERSIEQPGGIEFPTTARFAVAAQLRAGALVRKSGFFNTSIEDVVPINSYAQYIVKYTVAMIPQTVMVASDEPIMPKPDELKTHSLVVPKKSLLETIKDAIGWTGLGLISLIVLVVLAFVFPPVMKLFSAILGLFTNLINRLSGAVKP